MRVTYDEAKARALEALAAGDVREAWQRFRGVLEYPARPDDWTCALTVLAQIGEPIAGGAFAQKARAAARKKLRAQRG